VTVPFLCIEIPVEGRVAAYFYCGSYEEEQRLRADLKRRDVLGEIMAALAQLYAVLDDREGTS
jgi:hypothetical protein